MSHLKLAQNGTIHLTHDGHTRLFDAIKDQTAAPLKKMRMPLETYRSIASKVRLASPQARVILFALFRNDYLTSQSAAWAFNCLSLSSRISELRKCGLVIERSFTRMPSGQKVGIYRLAGWRNGT